ncbi:MAG: RNA polymerase sigma factor region1.1 domain-containing protein, partial [Planctomycetota bacterium]
MTDKIDQTIKLLVDEGRRKGFLTYADMSKLMEDQFLPPDKMDQVFVGLEDAGIDVVDDNDAELSSDVTTGAQKTTTQPTAAETA